MADTRRDIIQRIKVNGEDCSHHAMTLNRYFTGDPTVGGSAQKQAVDAINANITAMTTAMAAYAAATP